MLRPTLRRFRASDFEALLPIWYRAWHDAFPNLWHPKSLDEWRTRLRDEVATHNSVWVAETDNRLVGFLAMDTDTGYIDQLFVNVELQRRGAGSALIDLAKSSCPFGLRLHTLIENAPARAFYEKHGFRPGAVETNAFNGLPNIEYIWEPPVLTAEVGC